MKLALLTLKKYIKEPYPFYYGNTKRLLLALFLISLFSFGFSYFFEPFEVNVTEHKIPSIWILVLHAFAPFPITLLYFGIINKSGLDTTSWILGKELLLLLGLLLSIGVTSFLIRDLIYTNPDNWSFRYFGEELRNTILVGLLVLLIVLPLNLKRLIYKHQSLLKDLTHLKTQNETSESIHIKTNVINEDFELIIKDFIYAKVESNYTEIHTISSNGNSNRLIRITLKDFENQLTAYKSIFRTHRSYLVNFTMISSISGNAQGYALVLNCNAGTIPVARSAVKNFNQAYSKFQEK